MLISPYKSKLVIFAAISIVVILLPLFIIIPVLSMFNEQLVLVVAFIAIFAFFTCWLIGFMDQESHKNGFVRTKTGKKDVSLWLQYYNFIKDFSIMKERNFEEKNLWGYYFAYGLAVGINIKVIKRFKLEYERYIIK